MYYDLYDSCVDWKCFHSNYSTKPKFKRKGQHYAEETNFQKYLRSI